MLKFTKKVLNIRKADIYLYHQNETKFNYLLHYEKHKQPHHRKNFTRAIFFRSYLFT